MSMCFLVLEGSYVDRLVALLSKGTKLGMVYLTSSRVFWPQESVTVLKVMTK